ncbi:sulfotransferase family protein [Acrocarpospora catenulata]|uniref:sulfotransferase family protein n=1 Tax=Acrocarpospora catenulata TaxID=2836182 RepID=UPI001BD9EF72|nr:sulfotransferase [Acrocarpospora catenulata]
MRHPTHILVVNGVKVRQPVFVLGAPHSGADLLARALKRTPGFHLTMGRAAVARTVYAFARKPSIARSGGAPRVIRDVFAEAWQVMPGACGECAATCREAGGIVGAGPCVAADALTRFGDASPDLLYSAPVLLQAFPDARFVQLIRDGRDVVADMLADPATMAWFKPHMLSEDAEFPNPFLGVNSAKHRDRWKEMAGAGKSALRWRAAIRLSAVLRRELPREQLLTLRYEDLHRSPGETIETLSDFLGTQISTIALYGTSAPRVGIWRRRLSADDVQIVEKVGREELKKLGYQT